MKQTLCIKLYYRGYFDCVSHCQVRVWEEAERTPVVIATELEENKGTSVTNRVEHIARAVYRLLERPERGLVFIEHYPNRAYVGGRPLFKEQFARVEFVQTRVERFTCPTWRRISKHEVEMYSKSSCLTFRGTIP